MRMGLFLLAALTASALQAQPGPAPGMRVPETPGLGAPSGGGPKVCAVEMKATTKVIHGYVCKDYCRDHILPQCLRERLGMNCASGDCGNLSTFRVLTKKVVPGPDVPVCRVKELQVVSPGPVAVPPAGMNPMELNPKGP